MSLIPAAVQPYLLLIKVGAAALLLGGTFWYGHHRGVTGERAGWEAKVSQARQERIEKYESLIRDAKVAVAKSQAASAALGTKLADEQARTQTLSDALSRARLVRHDPNPIAGQPPVVRLGSAIRVCLNAAATGTDRATADCEALGVPVAATP